MAARKSKTAKTELAPQSDPRAPLPFEPFLSAAQKVLKVLGDDLLARADASPAVTAALTARWEADRTAKRTADVYEVYRRRVVQQVAAAWLLSVVFVRTLEDRGLVERNRIAGPGASDSQKQFFELAPFLTERDYLLTVFRELSNLDAAKDLFDAKHDLLWRLAPSAEGARALLELFRTPGADAPGYRFGQSDTRFLGDLYQLLDDDVRERFALLQTPRFVEGFILDRTLERSVQEFGLDATTLMDPTCGSGHFLLGAFERLFEHQLRANPSLDKRQAVERALGAVHGVDLNPYAVAIARFRLTLAALEKGAWEKIEAAPRLPLNLVVADSLLHRMQAGQATFADVEGQSGRVWKGEQFALEDEVEAKRVLSGRYTAVVGNPPYITVKDAALRGLYAKEYPRSAFKGYSLGAPFTERFFDLARGRGYVGLITANSFMKREFGKRVIEDFLRSVRLDLIVNTSGAYIPGHGTPTVILFGRNEAPDASGVAAVLAKRGEPATPADPEQGLVWRSIADHVDQVGYDDDFVSVTKLDRTVIQKHPWSLGGGGAAELKAELEERASTTLAQIVDDIGLGLILGEDEAFILPAGRGQRWPDVPLRPLVIGENIRDWSLSFEDCAIFPFDERLELIDSDPVKRHLWPLRRLLEERIVSGTQTMRAAKRVWWDVRRLSREKYATPLTITFAEVATHNHFVLDRGGKVFKQTAPIIKLPGTATEDDHLALLGYLNSSTACFWMKQVCQPKSNHSAERPEKGIPDWERYAFAGSALAKMPMVPPDPSCLIELARELDRLAMMRQSNEVGHRIEEFVTSTQDPRTVADEWWQLDRDMESRMVALQEELDWRVYAAFGLVPSTGAFSASAAMRADERPFLATDPPAGLSVDDRAVWMCRKELLVTVPELALLETLVNKRKWMGGARGSFALRATTYADRAKDACSAWLATRLEAKLGELARPSSAAELAHELTKLTGSLTEFATGQAGAGWVETVAAANSVPFVAAMRLSESGIEKLRSWERTWEIQRREDAGETIGDIPVPPKFDPSDYRDGPYFQLRGKLNVPKERFISYPGCESDEDRSPVYGWSGWNHLQQAQALAALYQKRKNEEGWGKERVIPMLAGLDELVPWVIQWHNEPDESFGGLRLGDYFRDFVAGECQALGLTLEEVRAWRPQAKTGRRKPARTAEVSREEDA